MAGRRRPCTGTYNRSTSHGYLARSFVKPEGIWTIEPYDRTAFSEAVRATWCVNSLPGRSKSVVGQDGRPLPVEPRAHS